MKTHPLVKTGVLTLAALIGLWAIPQPSLFFARHLGPWLAPVVYTLALEQSWSMFAGRAEAFAPELHARLRLRDGQTVEAPYPAERTSRDEALLSTVAVLRQPELLRGIARRLARLVPEDPGNPKIEVSLFLRGVLTHDDGTREPIDVPRPLCTVALAPSQGAQ